MKILAGVFLQSLVRFANSPEMSSVVSFPLQACVSFSVGIDNLKVFRMCGQNN